MIKTKEENEVKILDALSVFVRRQTQCVIEEKLAERFLEVVPEYVRVRTSKMQTSGLQRRLVLTALFKNFCGQENKGKTSQITSEVKQLFPKTYKIAWPEDGSMGVSIGQILRWLRNEIPEVKHMTLKNPETYALDHYYWLE
jgi:hypothetical protein